MGNPRSHHALKQAMPITDIMEHFGSAEPKEIAREVNRLGQRELQARFRVVYGTQTFSNNNTWLRRKLLEAAGLQAPKAAGRGRPSARTSKAASQSHPHVQALDSPPLSRSSSLASQSTGNCVAAKAEEVRRTKRARKPKLFEDMLVLGRHAAALSDDDDDKSSLDVASMHSGRSSDREASRGSGRPRKQASSPASTADDQPPAPGWVATSLSTQQPPISQPEPLVWARGAAQGFAAGHVLPAAAAWAPATPEPPPRWGKAAPMPEGFGMSAAARMAGSLLGCEEPSGLGSGVGSPRGDLLLPDWARLPNSEPADSDASAGTAQHDGGAPGLRKRTYLQAGLAGFSAAEPASAEPLRREFAAGHASAAANANANLSSPPGTPPVAYFNTPQLVAASSGCYSAAALGLAPAAASLPAGLPRSASAYALDRLLEEMGSGDAAFCSGPAVGTDAATGEKLDAFWDSVDQATDAMFEPRGL